MRTGDVALLERILAPEWTFFHSTGHQQSREDFLRQFRESQRSFQKFERDNIEVHVYGEAAVLTARTYRSETVEGKKFEGAVRSMFIYAKRNGQWQLVATQVTAFAPPK